MQVDEPVSEDQEPTSNSGSTTTNAAQVAPDLSTLWTSTNQEDHRRFRAGLRESELTAAALRALCDSRPVGLSGVARDVADEMAAFIERLAQERTPVALAIAPLSQDEQIELYLLQACNEQHRQVSMKSSGTVEPCALETDLRAVIGRVMRVGEPEAGKLAAHWLDRLAPLGYPPRGPLRRCADTSVANGPHKYHARPLTGASDGKSVRIWERLRELETRVSRPESQVQMDQKFGVLRSPRQFDRDYLELMTIGKEVKRGGVIFLDIDGFKSINETHLETVVDMTVLDPFQRAIDERIRGRGTVPSRVLWKRGMA